MIRSLLVAVLLLLAQGRIKGTPSGQPSSQPSVQPSNQPLSQPTDQPTSNPSAQQTYQPSNQPSLQPTVKPSSQPSSNPSCQPSCKPSCTPTTQPTLQPTSQPIGIPSGQPTTRPSSQPSIVPSSQPSLQPTVQPTHIPSNQPSNQPSHQPSSVPTLQPTSKPSSQPTCQPISLPSIQPSIEPTSQPSQQPSAVPSAQPVASPSGQPSTQPSSCPSTQSSTQPSSSPSCQPSHQPTSHPSAQPSERPTGQPTTQPTTQPSFQPAAFPTSQPSQQPTAQPSRQPISAPTAQPSTQPSQQPSSLPTMQPSSLPSTQPMAWPSTQPTMQPSHVPTVQPSNIPSMQPSSQPSSSPTQQPSVQPSQRPTLQPSSQPSVQPSIQPSELPSAQPSVSPSAQPSSQPRTTPTAQPSAIPTFQPSKQPLSHPSTQPSSQPTSLPSHQPTALPTIQPSTQPSTVPTAQPSIQPSHNPTMQPSAQPSVQPSCQPSCLPSAQPSTLPSAQPTAQPSGMPSSQPSQQPSKQPSAQPSEQPSRVPSQQPNSQPTVQPSLQPSQQPSSLPSTQPSTQPTGVPSIQPSSQPTVFPSGQPSVIPTNQPTVHPSSCPSSSPTNQPSNQPSSMPTSQPTAVPSVQPSSQPSAQPSSQPSTCPTVQPSTQPSSVPSLQPTTQPSMQPSQQPTAQPSAHPSTQPSTRPSQQPSTQPSSRPTGQPMSNPSAQPSNQPSALPTVQPLNDPTAQPSSQPSALPTEQPTCAPSVRPSAQPTSMPSTQPSSQPSTQPSQQPTSQPSSMPSVQPSIQPSSQPSQLPSAVPTSQPTACPSSQPSVQPSAEPSGQPSCQPSGQPTMQPSAKPTNQPSTQPSSQPSTLPSSQPSCAPSGQPFSVPSVQPSTQPTAVPSVQPSSRPTCQPTAQPSQQPSTEPSAQPSAEPTTQPTTMPSVQPSSLPSSQPSSQPSSMPSSQPTLLPTSLPSTQPSDAPTSQPSPRPSSLPTAQPSSQPSAQPVLHPTSCPSGQPSATPSVQPSVQPSAHPSRQPFSTPTGQPTRQPSAAPTCQPTRQPTGQPSSRPTTAKQVKISIEVTQSIRSSSRAKFLSDPKAADVFKATIISLVPGLEKSNIIITNVTDVILPYVTPLAIPQAVSMHSANNMHLMATSGINVAYTVVFIAQRVVVENSDPAEAYNIVSTQLSMAVRSGLFTSSMQNISAAENSFAFSAASSAPGSLAVATTFVTVIVKSAKPTSQPSSQPSGSPSSLPSCQPSSRPTSQPSRQPSSIPTSQPSSAPTLTIETQWELEVGRAFSEKVTAPQSYRTSYYSLDVSGSDVYGSCESWNSYLQHSLRVTNDAKVFESLSLIVESGQVGSSATTLACSDAQITRTLMAALTFPLPSNVSTVHTNVTIMCDAHKWVVRDCHRAGEVSRALCVDCENPCEDYDCSSYPGIAVLSPCTRQANCAYLKGSMQILTGYYSDREGDGYISVVTWYGVMCGFIVVSVIVYNRLILNDLDWKYLRSVPALTLRKHNVSDLKKSNFESIVPEPPQPVASRPGTSRSIHTAQTSGIGHSTGLAAINSYVAALFDRLSTAGESGWITYDVSEAVHISQLVWYRILSYNRYLAPYSRATQRERFVHGLNVLTRISWLFFCVALCFWFNYGEDDESCYSKSDIQECGERTPPFNSNEEYCAWVGVGGNDGGGQPIHQSQCIWHMYTGNVTTVLNIVIVTIIATCIPRILYTNLLVEGVLLAPGGVKNMFAYRSRRSQFRGMQLARKARVVDDNSSHLQPSTDARFFTLALANEKGGVGYLESGNALEDTGMLFRSFMFTFTQYRNAVLTMDDDKSREFTRQWQAANSFVLDFKGTLQDLTEEFDVNSVNFEQKQSLADELLTVQRTSTQLGPEFGEYAQHDPDQFAVRLLVTFFTDLLGRDSIHCKLIRTMLRDLLQDNVYFRDVRNWVKFCVVLLIIATIVCLVYGTIEVLKDFSQRRQWYWIIAAVIAVGVDLVLVEGVEALWFRWALPLCVADSLAALKRTVMKVLDHFQRSHLATPQTPSRPKTSQSVSADAGCVRNSFKAFSMPNYQFISTNIAHRFPKHIASRIVLSYESVYPRTITSQRWPSSGTAMQYLTCRRPWSSGLGFESIGYVLFSQAAMWIAVLCPPFFQQIMLIGLVCLVIWLVSWLVYCLLRGELLAVYIASAVLGCLLLAVLSYRFSWDHDSEHYGAGLEALHVEEINRDLRLATPIARTSKSANRQAKMHQPIDHFPEPPVTPVIVDSNRRSAQGRPASAAAGMRPGSSSSALGGDRPLTAGLISLALVTTADAKRDDYYLSSSDEEESSVKGSGSV